MFREMRRKGQQMSRQECEALLAGQPRGVLAVHGEDGYPYAFPMNYIYEDGRIYFHGAAEGHKMTAIKADNRVSFCVMDSGYKIEGEWPLHINSVIIFGKIRVLEDREEVRSLARKLALKYYPTPEEAEEEVVKAADRVQVMELTIDHMTGKKVKES